MDKPVDKQLTASDMRSHIILVDTPLDTRSYRIGGFGAPMLSGLISCIPGQTVSFKQSSGKLGNFRQMFPKPRQKVLQSSRCPALRRPVSGPGGGSLR